MTDISRAYLEVRRHIINYHIKGALQGKQIIVLLDTCYNRY